MLQYCFPPQPPPGPEPVSVESDSYNMEHRKRGYALLINQERFSTDLQRRGFTKRTGTQVDETNIRRKLTALGTRPCFFLIWQEFLH